MQINRVVTPTRRGRSNQKGLRNPNDSNPLEENHVVNTFKNISKSKSKVFDNAQRIRYKKTIQNYERIENYMANQLIAYGINTKITFKVIGLMEEQLSSLKLNLMT